MSEDEAFLKAIIAEPDDDAPRLIYADWLEERGDPRAEFIRVQCALAGSTPRLPDKEALRARARLCQRSQMLRKTHESEWFGPVIRLAGEWRFGWRCDRGFVDAIEFWPSSDGAHFPLDESRLAELSRLGPIQGLKKGKGVTIPELQALLVSPLAPRLRWLCLDYSDLRDEGAQLLGASPALSGLRRLSLAICRIGDAGAAALSESRALSRLERLDLTHNRIGGPAKQALRERFGRIVTL